MKLALALLLLAVMPLANALPAPTTEHVRILTATSSRVDIEVHYADGVGSTRFAFVQLTGPTGSSVDRLKPSPECTEWIGTFTEAAVLAGLDDNVSSRRARFSGAERTVPLAVPLEYSAPFNIEVASSLGGMRGRILVCDRAGDGLVHLTLNPVAASFGAVTPIVARVSLEESS